jgi:predicted dehydrogenase
MDIYGVSGEILIADRATLQLRKAGGETRAFQPAPLAANYREPLGYFRAVARGEAPEHPLSSLETNLIVTEILDAARASARSHQSIELPDQPGG